MNFWFDHQCEKRKDGIKSSCKRKSFKSIRQTAEALSFAEVIMIVKCQVSVSSLLLNIPKATFPRVLKAMAQSTRSSQWTSVEERAAEGKV